MWNFILWLADASFRGAVVTLVVLVVRQLFRKTGIASKYVSLLWILPYLCLVLPWQIESDFSIWGRIPGYEGVLTEEMMVQHAKASEAVADWNRDIMSAENHESKQGNTAQMPELVPMTGQEIITNVEMSGDEELLEGQKQYSIMKGIQVVWFTGVMALMVYAVLSCICLKHKVLCSQCVQNNIYYADDIRTPFVWGMVHPRIYLPSDMPKEHVKYVVEHEKTHIFRKDCIKKPVAFLISCIHWFNPFVWLAFYLLEMDIEMACDEETIQRIGLEKKQEYASVLLLMAVGTKRFQWAGMPLSFGEGDVKRRITNVLKYKRTMTYMLIPAVVVVAVLALVFLTGPRDRVSQGDVVGEVSREQNRDDAVDEVSREQSQSDAVEELPREPGQVDAGSEGAQEFILPEGAETVESTVPMVTEATEPGADSPILDYASKEMLIFHDYYGLFVYNRERGMIGAIDLKAIGCHFTQGDHYCEVQVEQDGSKVYMHVLSREDMYVYDIVHNVLYREPYDVSDIAFFRKIKEIEDCVNPDYTVLRSRECAAIDNGYHYLESGSGMIIDLCWVCEPYNSTYGDRECMYLFR